MSNQKSSANSSGLGSRRNSHSAGVNSDDGHNIQNNNGISRSSSEKSTAESSSKLIDSYNKKNVGRTISLINNNNASEPIQLFKKINELANSSKENKNQVNQNHQTSNPSSRSNSNSIAANKKRISLLIARKN